MKETGRGGPCEGWRCWRNPGKEKKKKGGGGDSAKEESKEWKVGGGRIVMCDPLGEVDCGCEWELAFAEEFWGEGIKGSHRKRIHLLVRERNGGCRVHQKRMYQIGLGGETWWPNHGKKKMSSKKGVRKKRRKGDFQGKFLKLT